MKNWYDRGAKVHRSPRVHAEAQRRILARKKREERTARAAAAVGEEALRKQRKARRERFEWKRACYRKHLERQKLLARVEKSPYLKATNSSHTSGTALAKGETILQIKYRVEA